MTVDSPSSPSRRTSKGNKRARTRAKLLDAARDLTRAQGFETTSLQDIARQAGMTTGAIYGNFRDRDALFMALAERQWAAIRPKFRRGSSFADKMRAVGDAVIAAIPERRAGAVGALTFRAYALKHEAVRVQFRESMAKGYESGAAWFTAMVEADDLPMPAPILVRVLNALIEGLLFQSFLTPELMSDAVIHAAFAALAGVKTHADARVEPTIGPP